MRDVNQICLTGHIEGDCEIRSTQKGSEWATFRVLVQGGTEAEPRKSYVKCKTFVPDVVKRLRHVEAGQHVALSGRLEPGSYTNKNGDKVWTMEVVTTWLAVFLNEDGPDDTTTPSDRNKLATEDEIPF